MAGATFDAEAFALVVHSKRTLNKHSLDDLAHLAGVEKSVIWRVEGQRGVSVTNFLKLCQALREKPLTFLVWKDAGRVRRGREPA